MSRILLVNQGHTDNIGDQAINAVLTRFLTLQGHEVVHAPYEDMVEYGRLPGRLGDQAARVARHMPPLMDRWNKTRIGSILSVVGPIDAAVIGGGELLASTHLGFVSSFTTWCDMLHDRGIPVMVSGVSGDWTGGAASRHYARALRQCSYVSVRDRATQRMLLEHYGIHSAYAPDVVFSYGHLFGDVQDTSSVRHNVLCIPVHFREAQFRDMGLQDEDAYVRYLGTTLRAEGQSALVVVTSTLEGDSEYPRHIAKRLQTTGVLQCEARTGLDLDQMVGLLKTSRIVVSARMHACILGAVYGCEILPIPYREKLRVFAKEYATRDSIERAVGESFDGLLALEKALR